MIALNLFKALELKMIAFGQKRQPLFGFSNELNM